MKVDDIKEILESLRGGGIGVDEAMSMLKHLPFKDMEFATLDSHRELRQGFPEVIYGQGKDWEKISAIMKELDESGQNILVTRLDGEKAARLMERFGKADYSSDANVMRVINHKVDIRGRGVVIVVAAGTSDIGVAEEARLTAEIMGNRVDRIYDVGVAGIHRLLRYREKLDSASVIIVVAGMEGALPSVVSGLVSRPVIAVPTSVGYGASFGGVAALLAMLNSCSSGVTVVNIDNGFGAAFAASLINRE